MALTSRVAPPPAEARCIGTSAATGDAAIILPLASGELITPDYKKDERETHPNRLTASAVWAVWAVWAECRSGLRHLLADPI